GQRVQNSPISFFFFVLGIHLGRGHWRFGEQKLCPIPKKGRTSKQLPSWEQEKKAGSKQAKLLDKQQEQRGMGGGITDTRLLHRNAFLLMPKMMMPRALDEPSKPVYLHCNLNCERAFSFL
ncbi:hypothetical protein CTAM01_06259, partial [Colletotrichum tamarilloi]